MSIIKNLTVDQNSTFSVNIGLIGINGSAYNLTGFTASSHIKKTYTSSKVSGTFVCSIFQPTTGVVYLSLSDTQSKAIPAGRYMYDVIVENSTTGEKYRAIEGIVTVLPAITT